MQLMDRSAHARSMQPSAQKHLWFYCQGTCMEIKLSNVKETLWFSKNPNSVINSLFITWPSSLFVGTLVSIWLGIGALLFYFVLSSSSWMLTPDSRR